jgi:hypothetical protein
LIEEAGFRIERLTYTHAVLFPFVLAVRTTERLIGLATSAEPSIDILPPPAPVNALFSSALAVEAWLLRRFDLPFGSSLLCLARKPERA